MFDFQKLDVYKKAVAFHQNCKQIISQQLLEKYVADQLGRASYSVPLNIAEGSGKFSKADRKNYFITARASIFECVACLELLTTDGRLKESDFIKLNAEAAEISKMLYKMISTLQKQPGV